MAKKMNNNTFEFKGISYTLTNRVRDKSEVRDVVYSIESYVKAVDEGKICRDPLIQRTDDQWSRKQRSKFIEAILRDRPIGSITTAKGRAESRNYRITSLLTDYRELLQLSTMFMTDLRLTKKHSLYYVNLKIAKEMKLKNILRYQVRDFHNFQTLLKISLIHIQSLLICTKTFLMMNLTTLFIV